MIGVVEVTVNGASRQLDEGTTLGTLDDLQGRSGRGFAIAVDGEVVPRADWPRFVLRSGQVVEVLAAVQGG